MKILICGAGKGSWEMRGIQLGAALGARVTSSPTDADFAWCDLVILVKKHAVTFAPRAHKAGKPIVWDALDFWAQPAQNSYTRDAALLALHNHAKVIKPALIIGATEAMAADAAALGFRSAYLPHHSWAGLVPTPPREVVGTVAYEGNPAYLGRWHGWIKEACERRGWLFDINPANLSKADIIVAFRDGPWDGWICREWKSGVKIVNAMAARRPIFTQPSAAERELNQDGAVIDSRDDLDASFDFWSPLERRDDLLPGHRYGIETVSAQYLSILSTVEASCATA